MRPSSHVLCLRLASWRPFFLRSLCEAYAKLMRPSSHVLCLRRSFHERGFSSARWASSRRPEGCCSDYARRPPPPPPAAIWSPTAVAQCRAAGPHLLAATETRDSKAPRTPIYQYGVRSNIRGVRAFLSKSSGSRCRRFRGGHCHPKSPGTRDHACKYRCLSHAVRRPVVGWEQRKRRREQKVREVRLER